jgi:hypothetical protein
MRSSKFKNQAALMACILLAPGENPVFIAYYPAIKALLGKLSVNHGNRPRLGMPWGIFFSRSMSYLPLHCCLKPYRCVSTTLGLAPCGRISAIGWAENKVKPKINRSYMLDFIAFNPTYDA